MQHAGSSRSLKASTIALTSSLLFIVSIVNPYVYHAAQILFVIIFTIGVLIVDMFGGATLIAFIAGLLNSPVSIVGPFTMLAWLVRGSTTDLLFRILKIYGYHPFHSVKVALAMTVSSLVTGLFHYGVMVKALGLIPEPPFPLLALIFIVSAASTFMGAVIAVKVVNRLRRELDWCT